MSEFVKEVESGEVVYARVSQDQRKVVAELKDGEIEEIALPAGYNVVNKLLECGVPVEVVAASSWLGDWWPVIMQIVVFGVLYTFLTRGAGGRGPGGIGGFLQSGATVKEEPETGVTFADVAGVEAAKRDLMEVVDFLKNPERYSVLGARVPSGVLLYGPPGTGKTLLAKAVAGEAGVPFLSCSGSDFMEAFVGVGAARVRDIFKKAGEKAPCIIFIDEIDTIGKARGGGLGTPGNDERDQTINQLLTLMDGFEDNGGVIVMAATNRLDILDEALTRPGRFDRKIAVELPDYAGRQAILGVHTASRPLADDVDIAVLAKISVGFSGADLQNWCNEASIYAAREGEGTSVVAGRHFDLAFEKVTIGEERRTMLVTEEKRRLVAFHESGHALMALLVNDFDTVRKVSILPRGRTGGVTAFLPKEENLDGGGLVTREYLENRIMVALGGRIAEEIVYGWDRVTTGAAGDMQEVYNLAYRMVVTYGMSRRLGPVNWDNGAGNKESIQEEVRWLVDRLYHRASDLMMGHVFYLHRLAETLLEKETLEWEDIQWCTTGISCNTV